MKMLGWLFDREKVFEVVIGFKSGRSLVLHVSEFEVKKDGDALKSISWKLHKSCSFSQMLYTNLGEVETITSREI